MLRLALAVLALFPSLVLALPFWGAQQSSPPLTPPMTLKPGEFVWLPALRRRVR